MTKGTLLAVCCTALGLAGSDAANLTVGGSAPTAGVLVSQLSDNGVSTFGSSGTKRRGQSFTAPLTSDWSVTAISVQVDPGTTVLPALGQEIVVELFNVSGTTLTPVSSESATTSATVGITGGQWITLTLDTPFVVPAGAQGAFQLSSPATNDIQIAFGGFGLDPYADGRLVTQDSLYGDPVDLTFVLQGTVVTGPPVNLTVSASAPTADVLVSQLSDDGVSTFGSSGTKRRGQSFTAPLTYDWSITAISVQVDPGDDGPSRFEPGNRLGAFQHKRHNVDDPCRLLGERKHEWHGSNHGRSMDDLHPGYTICRAGRSPGCIPAELPCHK